MIRKLRTLDANCRAENHKVPDDPLQVMRINKVRQQKKLSRTIFRYHIITGITTLLIVGLFWGRDKHLDYRNSVALLKKTYSEARRAEIKANILQVKDYIRWVQHRPGIPLNRLLAGRFRELRQPLASVHPDTAAVNRCLRSRMGNDAMVLTLRDKAGKLLFISHPGRTRGQALELVKAGEQVPKEILRRPFPVQSPEEPQPEPHLLVYSDDTLIPGMSLRAYLPETGFDSFLKEFIVDTLSRIRYGKDDYIFINTMEGQALVSNGKINDSPVSIVTGRDTAWVRVFRVEQQSASVPGGIFYTYRWKKISSDTVSLKTSYFSYVASWDWVIGTGFYEDDVNMVLEQKRNLLIDELKLNLARVALILGLSALLSYLFVIFFARRFSRNIRIFQAFFEKAAREAVSIDKSQVNYQEFASIADAANTMVVEGEKAKAELRESHEKYLDTLRRSEETYRQLSQTLEERVAERTHRLTIMNRELAAFSYTISHDLRSPVRAIIGYASILKEDHSAHLDEEGLRVLDVIKESAGRMNQLISDLLEFSRFGQVAIRISDVKMEEMAAEVFRELTAGYDSKKIDFRLDSILDIRTDPALIRQVWVNLVGNAIKFSSGRERPLIEIGSVSGWAETTYYVRDNGAGFNQAHAGKLFGVFNRLHDAREFEGTGVGLAIVQRIITRMNGKVWAEGKPDEGATFYFSLPGRHGQGL